MVRLIWMNEMLKLNIEYLWIGSQYITIYYNILQYINVSKPVRLILLHSLYMKMSFLILLPPTGESQVSLTHGFRVGRSTVHYIIKDVAKAIIDLMLKEFVKVSYMHFNQIF